MCTHVRNLEKVQNGLSLQSGRVSEFIRDRQVEISLTWSSKVSAWCLWGNQGRKWSPSFVFTIARTLSNLFGKRTKHYLPPKKGPSEHWGKNSIDYTNISIAFGCLGDDKTNVWNWITEAGSHLIVMGNSATQNIPSTI